MPTAYECCDRAHGLADITGELGASATPESIAPTRSTAERRSRPTGALEHGAELLRSPRKAMRRLGKRLRRYRRSMRDRWTRRAVFGLARLLQQPEQPGDAVTRSTG